VAVLFATGIAVGASQLATPDNIASYYIWRLQKDNGTEHDHLRAREKLLEYLRNTERPYRELVRLLTVPNLPAKTADDVLSLFLRSQPATVRTLDIQPLVAESLRTENSYLRIRIQKVLLYLAMEKGSQVPQNLLDWQPDPKDTATSIDQIIHQWKQVR
jgi:hypothetical protein